MNPRTRILLVVVAIVLAAYPLSAWLIGLSVEGQLQEFRQHALEDAPYLTLVKRDYHRGFYKSTEELTIGLGGPFAQAAKATPAGDALASFRVTVRNTIHHGPLPGMRTVALATIDTELVLPPEMQQRMAEALPGGKQGFTLHTRLGWFGGATTVFTSPAFQFRSAKAGTVNWRGAAATIDTARGMKSWSGNFNAGGVEFEGEKGRAQFEELTGNADMRQVFDSMYVGKAALKLKRFEFHGATPAGAAVLQGLAMASTSSANGEYMDTAVQLTADALQAGPVSVSHVAYELSFGHVHGQSLAGLTKALRDAQRDASAASAALMQEKMRDAFQKFGTELLLHDPVVEIPRIAFTMPEGELHFNAKLTAPGLKREEVAGPAGMFAIIQHLKAAADLHIDTALADKLFAASGKGGGGPDLAALEKLGYIKREGSSLTTHLSFDAGKLTVNGQPYPPAPGATH